jgi:hypothetical protein
MTWPNQGNPDPYQQQQQPYQQPSYGQPQLPTGQPYDQPYGAQPTSAQPASGTPYSPGPAYPVTPAPDYGYQAGYQQPYQQQPYQQQPYQQQAYLPPAAYPQNSGTNTMAILALVFAFVFSPLGIVFGHIARKQIKQTGEQGDGLALAGMIIGYISLGIGLVVCCIYGIAVAGLFGSAATSGS